MSDKSIDCQKKLKELCITMIEVLDDLKAKGRISEEEYHKHTEMKERFLKKINY